MLDKLMWLWQVARHDARPLRSRYPHSFRRPFGSMWRKLNRCDYDYIVGVSIAETGTGC